MKTKILSTIVAYSCLLLIQGLDSISLYKNGTVDPSRRIINGYIAHPDDFRFIVLLRIAAGNGPHLCGGSVISNHFILTAGHCLYNKVCDTIEISPSTWEPGERGNIFPIECWPHELFNGHDFDFDIGILKTEDNLLSDGRFAKIDLPPPNIIYGPGVTGIIAGWGLIDDGSYAKYLMRAELTIYSWVECNEIYKIAELCADDMACPVRRLPAETFCLLGKPSRFPGACIGDSGGPVIINGVLAGVMTGMILTPTSYCEAGFPGLNINVADFIPWIRFHILPDVKERTFQ